MIIKVSQITDKWIGWKWIDAFAKIAIPISVTLLAICQNNIQKKNEKSIQELILYNQKSYQDTSTDLKLVEILWPLLVSSDSTKKMSSLKLAQYLRPELSTKLMHVVLSDETQPWYIRKEASEFIANSSLKQLTGVKLNIYYNANNHESNKMSKEIERIITEKKLKNNIVIVNQDSSFFEHKYNYIYFAEKKEESQAQTLVAIIQSVYPFLKIKLNPLPIDANNALSLYLFHVNFDDFSMISGPSPGVYSLGE